MSSDDFFYDIIRQFQFLRRDQHYFDAVSHGQSFYQRMNCPSVFKVAAESDCQVIQTALFPVYRKNVGKSLSRMIVTPVSGVYDRYERILSRHKRRSLIWMAHCYYISIAAYNSDGIRHAFSFRDRRISGVRKTYDVTAQFVHGSLKAQSRPCGRFIKKSREFFSFAFTRVFFRFFYDVHRRVYETVKL